MLRAMRQKNEPPRPSKKSGKRTPFVERTAGIISSASLDENTMMRRAPMLTAVNEVKESPIGSNF
jgi:hypothetical protein